jgi:hypothetical protein
LFTEYRLLRSHWGDEENFAVGVLVYIGMLLPVAGLAVALIRRPRRRLAAVAPLQILVSRV